MNKELLSKYCTNCCTEEELKSVLLWFEEGALTLNGKSLLSKIWNDLPDKENNPDTDFNLLLDKIHHEINLTQAKNYLERSIQDERYNKRRLRFIDVFTKIAAILIFPVLGFGLFMFTKYQSSRQSPALSLAYNEVFSSVDAITKVTLPDGSDVWLNHNSSLRYPAMFMGDFRTVELAGEGYFEVAHNPLVPFIVKAGTIQIKALGTTFNIMAYPDEDRIETSLISGAVELQRLEPCGDIISLVAMRPSDLTVFQKSNNKISTLTFNDDRCFSWKNGKLVFSKEPLGEVIKKLSRWFNVDIQIEDPEILDLTYTATFVHETLPQVMELLKLVTPINYSISNRKETSDGTFTRRKIIISYRRNN